MTEENGTSYSANKGNLIIFPNPSESGIFYLNHLGEGTKTIHVYDLAGSLKASFTTTSDLFYELSLANLTKGVYVLRITSDIKVSMHKIVVQ